MTRLPASRDSLLHELPGNHRTHTAGGSAPCTGEQQQLADDLLGLAQALRIKLEGYSSCGSAASADPQWAQETGNAVAWMKTTIEDLTATIVGLQAAPGKCSCRLESPTRAEG